MIQITAYEVTGGLVVHAVHAEATESGYQWTQLLHDIVHEGAYTETRWDQLWTIGQRLSELALERGRTVADQTE